MPWDPITGVMMPDIISNIYANSMAPQDITPEVSGDAVSSLDGTDPSAAQPSLASQLQQPVDFAGIPVIPGGPLDAQAATAAPDQAAPVEGAMPAAPESAAPALTDPTSPGGQLVSSVSHSGYNDATAALADARFGPGVRGAIDKANRFAEADVADTAAAQQGIYDQANAITAAEADLAARESTQQMDGLLAVQRARDAGIAAMEALHVEQQKAADARIIALRERSAQVRAMTVDPQRFYKAMSGGQQALTGLAVMAQAYLGMKGIKIDVVESLNRQVDQDIDAQKENLRTQQWAFKEDKFLFEQAALDADSDAEFVSNMRVLRTEQAIAMQEMMPLLFAGEHVKIAGDKVKLQLQASQADEMAKKRKEYVDGLQQNAGTLAGYSASMASVGATNDRLAFDRERFTAEQDAAKNAGKLWQLPVFDQNGKVYASLSVLPDAEKKPGFKEARDTMNDALAVSQLAGTLGALIGEDGLPSPNLPLVNGMLDSGSSAQLKAAATQFANQFAKATNPGGPISDADFKRVQAITGANITSISRAAAEDVLRIIARASIPVMVAGKQSLGPFVAQDENFNNVFGNAFGNAAATLSKAPKQYDELQTAANFAMQTDKDGVKVKMAPDGLWANWRLGEIGRGSGVGSENGVITDAAVGLGFGATTRAGVETASRSADAAEQIAKIKRGDAVAGRWAEGIETLYTEALGDGPNAERARQKLDEARRLENSPQRSGFAGYAWQKLKADKGERLRWDDVFPSAKDGSK